jgi:hypothetical protein
MPTHRVWSESPQDPIRFKNLLREAESLLVHGGMRHPEARQFLASAHELQKDPAFWKTQCDGLSVFISADGLREFRLPTHFQEFVTVSDRFHIKPLLPLLSGDGRFFALALSLDNVRLLAGSHFSLVEMELPDTPVSLAEALKYDEFETHQQLHSGTARRKAGDRAAMFHGQGGAKDEANAKKRIKEFFKTVDNGVCKRLGDEQIPLVLVGLKHLVGHYRSANHYEYLADVSIEVNPNDLSLDDLHSRIWSTVEPKFAKARADALSAYEALSSNNPGRVSDQLDEVVSAAHFKRIDVLFATKNSHSWGVFDRDRELIETHREAQPGDQDLIDLAVAQTVRNAGTVYVTEPDAVPGESELAAIFRY